MIQHWYGIYCDQCYAAKYYQQTKKLRVTKDVVEFLYKRPDGGIIKGDKHFCCLDCYNAYKKRRPSSNHEKRLKKNSL